MLDRNPNTVRIVPLNYPLSSHKMAFEAAAAALAAHGQGKFWEFHHKLHENYRELSESKIMALAEETGLDLAEFKKDMNSAAVRNLIKRDIETGRKIGIRGIPAVFVNGKPLTQRSPEGFQEMIDRELNTSGR